MSYSNNVRKMHSMVLAALQDISGGDLEAAIDGCSVGDQSANPRQVLADLVWEKFETKDINGMTLSFAKVEGTFNSQAHTWFERTVLDRAIDPLPRRTIIDVAPVGVVPSPIVLLPESPFIMLYRRKS